MDKFILFVLDASSFIILWLIVPIIMISLVFIGRIIISRTAKGENKTAAQAGFFGGLILFTIYFINQLPSFRMSEISLDDIYRADIWGAFLGMFIGLVLLVVLSKIMKTKMMGFVTMILTFCGMASVFSYFFIRTFNDVLLPAILGVAFAVSLYVVISPKTVHDLLD